MLPAQYAAEKYIGKSISPEPDEVLLFISAPFTKRNLRESAARLNKHEY